MEKAYVQTVPDGKYLCPDFFAFTRFSCAHLILRAFMSRLLCVEQTFVRLCSDICAITRFDSVHVKTFVRSTDFRVFISWLPFVHQILCVHVHIFVRSPNFRVFTWFSCIHVQMQPFRATISCVQQNLHVHVQTFVCSTDFLAFTRFSCVHQVFVGLYPDICAFIKLGYDYPILCPLKFRQKKHSNQTTFGVGDLRCAWILNQQNFRGAWQGKNLLFSLFSFSFEYNKRMTNFKKGFFHRAKELFKLVQTWYGVAPVYVECRTKKLL